MKFKVGDKVRVKIYKNDETSSYDTVVGTLQRIKFKKGKCEVEINKEIWNCRICDLESIDNVNSPSHYKQNGKETIDTIKDSMSPDGFAGYLVGNILKYIARYKFKNGVEDLKKARWYLDKLISDNE